MNPRDLAAHVDLANPISWATLVVLVLGIWNTISNQLRQWRERPHLCVRAVIQGRQRCSFGDGIATDGDYVTLTLVNNGPKTVALMYVCGERRENGIRMPFRLHQHPRHEARLEPGELRSVWILDARALDDSVKWLGAADTLGHVWKLPWWELRRLFREERKARRAAMRQQAAVPSWPASV